MDKKRRATPSDFPSTRPWPVVQRRKIEKLKEARMSEFERLCNDSFEWLENYYQGCVYAANQNRPQTEAEQLNLSTYSHASGYGDEEQHTSNDRQERQTGSHQSFTDGAHNRTMIEQYVHQDHEASTPYAATNTPRASSPIQETAIDSPNMSHQLNRRSRSKTRSGQFQPKSPKTPRLFSPLRSPRSPHERHRITPKRTRLRVDASAATRRAMRIMRTARKKASELMGEQREGTRRGITRRGLASNNSVIPLEPLRSKDEESYRLISISRKDAAYLPPKASPFRLSAIAYTDPSYSENAVKQDRVAQTQATPGSRARDSMTLVSPLSRSSSIRSRNSPYISTPRLTRGPSVSSGMNVDQDVEIYQADYRRPRSSPFQDSTAPVRFNDTDQHGAESNTVDGARSSKSSGTNSRAPREVPHTPNTQGSVLSLSSILDSVDRNGNSVMLGRRSDQDERAAGLPGSHTTDRDLSRRGIDHSSETRINSMLKPQDSDIAPRSGSNTIAETKPAAQKDSHSITSGSAGTGSAFLVDHQPISRSRVGTTLPEKRTIGQRKPVTQTTGSQPQPPTSRLLKMTTTLPLMAPPAPTSGISASSQPQSSLTNTTGRAARPGIIGLSKDSQPTTQAVAAQTNSAVPSSASLNMWRQGAPRAPLPLTRPTESSLARSESQSALTRKPFLISKSTLLLKKPTRTVLQDSTLTARSLALSGIARAGTPTSPKKDTKRDIKLRELTPDVTSKTSTTSSASMQTLSTSSTSGTTMTSTLVSILAAQQSTSSTAKSLTNGLLRASRTQESQTRELQTEESTTSNKQLNDFNQSDNPFVVPAPMRPPPIPSWAQSQTRRRSHHERTLLPEIISESEDDGDESRDGKRDRHLEIPAWAEWSELEKAMHRQSQLNPEDIFGPLPVLDMGEIFPVKPNRLRPRTSSAHWSTTDRLTVQEVIRYNEDMGWSAKE